MPDFDPAKAHNFFFYVHSRFNVSTCIYQSLGNYARYILFLFAVQPLTEISIIDIWVFFYNSLIQLLS